MSIKIYEAFKLDSEVDMTDLMELLQGLRKDYLKSCSEFVDKTKGDKTYSEISNEIRQGMATSERSCYNFGASIMLYFFEGKTYIQFFGLDFTDGPHYKSLKAFCTDYHYQDQCDAWYDYEFDEGKITEQERDDAIVEYEERKRVWNGIYGERWRPNECGLVFEVCTKDDYYYIAGKVFNLPVGD